MSLTNTVPDKTGLFPKFDWPRVHNPAIQFDLDGGIANDVAAEEARACAEIEAALKKHDQKVAAILIEPMQGEGGDNHFRTEFMRKLRGYADSMWRRGSSTCPTCSCSTALQAAPAKCGRSGATPFLRPIPQWWSEARAGAPRSFRATSGGPQKAMRSA
jgi:hypothetical protein